MWIIITPRSALLFVRLRFVRLHFVRLRATRLAPLRSAPRYALGSTSFDSIPFGFVTLR